MRESQLGGGQGVVLQPALVQFLMKQSLVAKH